MFSSGDGSTSECIFEELDSWTKCTDKKCVKNECVCFKSIFNQNIFIGFNGNYLVDNMRTVFVHKFQLNKDF